MILDKLSTLNIRNLKILKEYVKFCEENNAEYGEKHHILPRALFPEFSNLNKNKWNQTTLTPENHYIAHAMLSESLNEPSMDYAWYAMNNKNFYDDSAPIELIGPEKHTVLLEKRNRAVSERMKNKVTAKDLNTGKNVQVSKEEFYSSDNLVGATIGKGGEHLKNQVSVLIDGKGVRINKEDFNPDIHVGLTKGKTMYKDKYGNRVQTDKNDPRVLSGELVGINKGKKYNHYKMVVCPHCGKEGKNVGGMKRHHFNNCKKVK